MLRECPSFLLQCFYQGWALNFVKGFFFFFPPVSMEIIIISTLDLFNMVYFITGFSNTEPPLHDWNKYHLAMVSYFLNVVVDFCSLLFIIFTQHSFVILVCNFLLLEGAVFIRFRYQDYTLHTVILQSYFIHCLHFLCSGITDVILKLPGLWTLTPSRPGAFLWSSPGLFSISSADTGLCKLSI